MNTKIFTILFSLFLAMPFFVMAGIRLLYQQSPEKSINVGGLTRGIYILKVTLDTGEIVTTQFLKR